jgi:hypothetical protein
MTARSGFNVRRFYGASAAVIRPALREIGLRVESAQRNRECAVARPCEIGHIEKPQKRRRRNGRSRAGIPTEAVVAHEVARSTAQRTSFGHR